MVSTPTSFARVGSDLEESSFRGPPPQFVVLPEGVPVALGIFVELL